MRIAIIFNVYVFDALICSKPKLEHSDLFNKRGGLNKCGVGQFFSFKLVKNVESGFFSFVKSEKREGGINVSKRKIYVALLIRQDRVIRLATLQVRISVCSAAIYRLI